MTKRSRYENTRFFQSGSGASRPFPGFRARDIGQATGVVEYSVKEWDRMDLIAHHYFGESDLWWRILDANPEVFCALDLFLPPQNQKPQAGEPENGAETIILIPGAKE